MSRHRITTVRCVLDHRIDPDRPRQALPTLVICGGHRTELYRLATDLPRRYDDLDRAHGTPGPRGPGIPTGIPFDDDIAEHRTHMVSVVASWCGAIASERGITPPADLHMDALAAWLYRHLEWVAAREHMVVALLGELRQISGRALHLADIRARRVPLAAQCLTHTGGTRCTGQVSIVIRGDDWTAHCETCDTIQDVGPYLRGVRSGKWITGEGVIMLARLCGLPCSPDVVRQWHHRRRITGQRQKDGSVLYSLASVQAYLTKRQPPIVSKRMAG